MLFFRTGNTAVHVLLAFQVSIELFAVVLEGPAFLCDSLPLSLLSPFVVLYVSVSITLWQEEPFLQSCLCGILNARSDWLLSS